MPLVSKKLLLSTSIAATLATGVIPLQVVIAAEDADATNNNNAIEEVIVTVQRREASMQEVPVSVTAVTSEDMAMAQVEDMSNIEQLSPSIKFDVTNSAANSANIMIRGIGTIGNSRAFEGAVGVFVDGVYRVRAGQAMQNWLDIDSLQILRGPQGTLFGKNTSAGALLLTSKAPDFDGMGGDYSVTVGDYGKIETRGAINNPVSDELAFRIAGLWAQQDGYIENPNGGDYNDRSPLAFKAQALFEPNDSFSLHVIADWSDESNNCCYGQVLTTAGALQPVIDGMIAFPPNTPFQLDPLTFPGRGLKLASKNIEDYEMVLSHDTDQNITDKGITINADLDLNSGQTLHSVTGIRQWKFAQTGMDADFTGANILAINDDLSIDSFSQELTLSGDTDGFGPFQAADYVFGAYYSKDELESNYQLVWEDQAQLLYTLLQGTLGALLEAPEGVWSDADLAGTGDSFAVFTHWNLDFSDQMGLSVGFRYSKDEKTGSMTNDFKSNSNLAVFRALGVQPGPDYDVSFDDSAVSGSIALHYFFNDDMMGYASYNRGYKAGGVNLDNTAAGTVANNPDEVPGAQPLDPSYKSEFVDGYELGLKADYWDNKARSNVALFYNDLTDLQNARFLGLQFTIDNMPEAQVAGLEMENTLLVNDMLSLDFAMTYLGKAEFGTDDEIPHLSERDFAHAPKFAGNLGATFDKNLTDNLGLVARLSMTHSGSQFTTTSNNDDTGAHNEFNASVGVMMLNTDISATLWCQNCTDERYITQHFKTPLQPDPSAHGYVAAPRTYGVTLRGSF